jgi:F0F1-type ATP synthase membrane subunit b/b'
MTTSRQDQGPQTPLGQAGATPGQPGTTGPAGTGGTPITPTPPQASSVGGTSGGSASRSGSPGEQVGERAKADAEAAASHARGTAEEVSASGRGISEKAKERAHGLVDDAKERARSMAGEQKNLAADRVTGFADALRHASSDLDQQGQSVVSGVVRQAADGLERVSGAMRSNDVDDLVGSIEDFARRQPAVFIGSAVLAGFGIARFMKSSSERRRERGPDYAGSRYDTDYTGSRYETGRGTTYEGGV